MQKEFKDIIKKVVLDTGSKEFGKALKHQIKMIEKSRFDDVVSVIPGIAEFPDKELSGVSIIALNCVSECVYNPMTGSVNCSTVGEETINEYLKVFYSEVFDEDMEIR